MSAEAVRDPEHDGVLTAIVARLPILWYRDFTASRTLDVRFQCLGVPKACISCSYNTGCGYCDVVLALQRRSRHVQGKVLHMIERFQPVAG